MNTSIHEYVVERLWSVKGKWDAVAEATGMPLSTIKKIARREVKDPRVSNVEKLARYFRKGR